MTTNNRIIVISVDDLATMLQQASDAHHEYERRMGVSDPNWPAWYANYVLERVLTGAPQPPPAHPAVFGNPDVDEQGCLERAERRVPQNW